MRVTALTVIAIDEDASEVYFDDNTVVLLVWDHNTEHTMFFVSDLVRHKMPMDPEHPFWGRYYELAWRAIGCE